MLKIIAVVLDLILLLSFCLKTVLLFVYAHVDWSWSYKMFEQVWVIKPKRIFNYIKLILMLIHSSRAISLNRTSDFEVRVAFANSKKVKMVDLPKNFFECSVRSIDNISQEMCHAITR